MKLTFKLVLLAWGLGVTGCSAPSASNPQSEIQNPKSQRGVLVTRTGEAAVEVNQTSDSLFEIAESYLRGHYKVTFVNRSLHHIEAESKTRLVAVKITALTTGSAGMSVTVTHRGDQHREPDVARDVADEILAAFDSSTKK